MLLVFNTAQLGRLLLQILSKTHSSLERKITVIKTLYLQNAVIFPYGQTYSHIKVQIHMAIQIHIYKDNGKYPK